MTTEKIDIKDFLPEKKWIEVSAGDSVRIIREFNELTQTQLAEMTGISLATLVAIESDQAHLDRKLTGLLARALKCPPEVLNSSELSKQS